MGGGDEKHNDDPRSRMILELNDRFRQTTITIQYVNAPCRKDSRILPEGTQLTKKTIEFMPKDVYHPDRRPMNLLRCFDTKHLYQGANDILLYKHWGSDIPSGNVAGLPGASVWAVDNLAAPVAGPRDMFDVEHVPFLVQCVQLRTTVPGNYILRLTKIGESKTGTSLFRGVLCQE